MTTLLPPVPPYLQRGGREVVRWFEDVLARVYDLANYPVTSVFGRTGAISAASGDYSGAKITNDSSATGSTVKDALNGHETRLDGHDTSIAALNDATQAATTTVKGIVNQAAAVASLAQTISAPPTQAEVQAISAKVDDLLAKLRTAGLLNTPS